MSAKKMRWTGNYHVDEVGPSAAECFREQERCLSKIEQLQEQRMAVVLSIINLKANYRPIVVEHFQPRYEDELRAYDRAIVEAQDESHAWLVRAQIAQADEVVAAGC